MFWKYYCQLNKSLQSGVRKDNEYTHYLISNVMQYVGHIDLHFKYKVTIYRFTL